MRPPDEDVASDAARLASDLRRAAAQVEAALGIDARAWPPLGTWTGGAHDEAADRRERWRADGRGIVADLHAAATAATLAAAGVPTATPGASVAAPGLLPSGWHPVAGR